MQNTFFIAIKTSHIVPQKILLVRTDRIGDVILTLPMADVLRLNYPDAVIDFLVSSRVAELVEEYPNINKVHAIEKESISGIRQLCKSENYDLAIVVHPTFDTAWGIYTAGVKYRLGSAYRWYSAAFNIKHRQHRKPSLKHELEYNLDLLNELNCKVPDDIEPHLQVSQEAYGSMAKKLKSVGMDVNTKYIVIHIPTLSSAKSWSNKNFVQLINMLVNNCKIAFNIILTGTKTDEHQVNSVIDSLENKDRVFGVFDLNLKELAALLKGASLFAGNSTGPIHIAAAVGTFVVGFYSPVRVQSPVRWGPYADRKKIFVPEKNDDSRDVMDDIKPIEVYNFINKYLTTSLNI